MTCPKCGADMKVIAIIEDPDELKRILRHPGCRAEQPEGCDQADQDRTVPTGIQS